MTMIKILIFSNQSQYITNGFLWSRPIYEGRFKSLWTGGSAPLLCRGRRWLLCQVVVVGVT
jgi:hypothetical protein